MRKDDNGLTAEDREREAQAAKLLEFKRNLPHRPMMMCPHTGKACGRLDCDPPYDCIEAEAGYEVQRMAAEYANAQARAAIWFLPSPKMTGLFIAAFLAFLLLVRHFR